MPETLGWSQNLTNVAIDKVNSPWNFPNPIYDILQNSFLLYHVGYKVIMYVQEEFAYK